MNILLIEDELKTAENLKIGFEENGYKVDLAFDGETGLSLVTNRNYDLIITDVIMPVLNGFELCRKIRDKGITTPLIMLTALGMTSDKITGFNAGTDDFMVKPCDFEELLIRAKYLIKKSKNNSHFKQQLTFGDLMIDYNSKEAFRSGNLIELTPKEFALLEYLMKNPGKVISRAELSKNVWNINFDTGTKIVEVYINYLRNKIDKGFDQKLIHTRQGMGYVLKVEASV